MAKKQSRQRDFSNSNQSLDSLLTFKSRPAPVLLPVPTTTPLTFIAAVGDRRLFQPDESTRPPHSARPGAARVMSGRNFNSLKFADPSFVSICAKRKIRKQVLFAKRKTAKGSRSPRRRNFWSIVSC